MVLNPFDPSVINAAYRGVQPGAAPMLGSSNLTNAIPLTKFKYGFNNIFNPAAATANTPAAPAQNPYGLSSEDWAAADSQTRQMAILLNANKKTPQEVTEERRALLDMQLEYDKAKGDQAQAYAINNSILNSLGSIGRSLGSRYGSDPNSVGEAYQRMAGLSVRQTPMAPLPDVPAVRYYNV